MKSRNPPQTDGWFEFQGTWLSIHLEAQLFGPWLWQQLQEWFAGGWKSSWLAKPFQAMSVGEGLAMGPRWKPIHTDWLSRLMFRLLVPANHPLVQLWQRMDWRAINRLCAPGYQNQRRGQRAWAPAQMVALLLLFFLLPAPSETALLRTVAIVPLYRWFCGFALFSPLPDHSSLYTFRKRIGEARFEAILTWVVGQCQQVGLIANQLTFFDMMGIDASAYRWTPYQRAVLLTYALSRYLELSRQASGPSFPTQLSELLAEVAIEASDNQTLRKQPQLAPRLVRSLERWTHTKGQPLWEQAIEEAVQNLLAETQAQPNLIAAEPHALRHGLKPVAQALKARLPHARGDLDACVGWVSDVSLRCGYWLGFLVDSLHAVITAVRLVPLNQMQHGQMLPALDEHRHRVGVYPHAVAADSAQDYEHVHRGLDGRQIQGYIASREHQGRGGGFGPKHFRYNLRGELLCPQGEVLEPGRPRANGLLPDRAKDCQTCPIKADCLPQGQQPDGPRLIHLVPEAHQRWLQNMEQTKTQAYKEAQRQRFASEGLFGLAERLHQAKKAPYRSQPMNLIAGLLIGTVMNLATLVRYGPGV